jgi:hypothetical protein
LAITAPWLSVNFLSFVPSFVRSFVRSFVPSLFHLSHEDKLTLIRYPFTLVVVDYLSSEQPKSELAFTSCPLSTFYFFRNIYGLSLLLIYTRISNAIAMRYKGVYLSLTKCVKNLRMKTHYPHYIRLDFELKNYKG